LFFVFKTPALQTAGFFITCWISLFQIHYSLFRRQAAGGVFYYLLLNTDGHGWLAARAGSSSYQFKFKSRSSRQAAKIAKGDE